MKKIITAFAAIAAAFSLVSCNKEQIEEPATDLKLNITVADLDGSADTKAVKTSWVSGDKINIWYEGNAQRDPDLVIKYDGSEWKKDATATVSGNEPAASGKIFFAYEGGNDLSKYSDTFNMYYGAMNLLYSNAWSTPTTYTYVNGTLTFNIKDWEPVTEFQVVLTGVGRADRYELKCSNLLKFSAFAVDGRFIYTANDSYDEYASSVYNVNGPAFYFLSALDETADAKYVFTIKNTKTNEEKTYTVTGKTHRPYTLTAIRIDVSKFKAIEPTTGTAQRTGGIDVKWVQLWENGPKFAEYNVGAKNNLTTDYGGRYFWGMTRDYSYDVYWPYIEEYNQGTDPLTGENDTATKLWGSNWRLPARAELQALIDNCDVVWTTENGVKGCKFTGKGNYSANSIFLPASGDYTKSYSDSNKGIVYGKDVFGYYWTSTPKDAYTAYILDFSSKENVVGPITRDVGRSVRAVLAE